VIEQRNRLDNMVYQVTKESKDWVDKLERAQVPARRRHSVGAAGAAQRQR